MRIACLRVPDFPLQALRRSEPELVETPLAVATGPTPRDPVVAVAAEAEALGVRKGMTAAQALRIAPRVLVRVTPPAVAAAADEALDDVAVSFSPRVKRGCPGEVLLDVGGLIPRFGREEVIAHELLRACRHVGLEGRIGVAASLGVARVASRIPAQPEERRGEDGSRSSPSVPSRPPEGSGGGVSRGSELARHAPQIGAHHYGGDYLWRQKPDHALTGALAGGGVSRKGIVLRDAVSLPFLVGLDLCVVPAGREAEFLAPLPIALLDPPPEVAGRLVSWGVHRSGELAGLPREEVALRLGSQGLALHRLACGETHEEFVPDPVREVLREGMLLEHPVSALEPFLFVLRGLLSRLAQRLELRGEGFAELLLELALEGGGNHEVSVRLVAATREVPAVLAMARLRLESLPPASAVEAIAVRVTPGRIRLVQGSLFGPPLPAPGRLAVALARLAALVGPERVGAPTVPDTHRPGAWAMTPFAPGDREQGMEDRGEGAAPVLRAMRPPCEVQVETAGGRPVLMRMDGLAGTVVSCAGPYRSLGEWWSDEPFARDDFDVAFAGGPVLRVYFDHLQRKWFVDGVYD